MSQPDWKLLETEGVRDVASQAARRVHSNYSEHIELEDLKQEALILVVTQGDLAEAIRAGELGLLQYRLEMDLINWCNPRAGSSQARVSYSLFEEADRTEDYGYARSFVPDPPLESDYTRESVEFLLPAVWDETYCFGLPKRDDLPDPDMPKGSSNKATANNLPASIADIKVGWKRAPLSLGERRALLLTYGLGWTQEEVGRHEGVSHQAISHRLYTGIGKIVARLNGGIWAELEDQAA